MPERKTPQAQIRSLIAGYWVSRMIYVAARLGVADLLRDRPRTAEDLAGALGVQAPQLYRMLRTLSGYGVFTEIKGKRFKLTPLGSTLRSDVPASMRAFALMLVGKPVWDAWEQLLYAIQTGQLPFLKVYGQPFYQYLEQHPDDMRIFGEAMTSLSGTENPAIVEAIKKTHKKADLSTIVDVAGGHGSLLALLLKTNPKAKGVLFDLPGVIARAGEERHVTEPRIAARTTLVPGDFFQFVPRGGDAYILKYILHNWDDEHCVKILANCRDAMNRKGRVLVADPVVKSDNAPDWGKLLDVQMMVAVSGKERTKEEFAALFKQAGLRLARVMPTRCPLSVVEAVRA
jgi:O-methyltransferase/methyltransferase family protein